MKKMTEKIVRQSLINNAGFVITASIKKSK